MDTIPTSTLAIALAVLLVVSGFFSLAETAMMAANRLRLKHRAQRGSTGARTALQLLAETDRLLGVILLGNNLINAAAATLTAVDAVRALEPFCAEFLYTHVDNEGLMGGPDLKAIMAVRDATSRRLTAAGGITTWDEIDQLDAAGVDAVVGMAIYTGQLPLGG